YPAASPYVTSVGGTQLIRSDSHCRYIPEEPNICLQEIAAYRSLLTGCRVTSGGGFSSFSEMPKYQRKTVQQYFKRSKVLPPTSYYNQSNRAYPDISLLAHNYIVKLNENVEIPIDGTSASSPTIAGLFSLINNRRL
ncbi:unnamed protein product, partial [Didymodactylos carnosus]